METQCNHRAKILCIWTAASVPVLLALLSVLSGCARDSELEPLVVTDRTPEPILDRGDDLGETKATPSAYRESLRNELRRDALPPALPPANTGENNEPIRQRNYTPSPAPVLVEPAPGSATPDSSPRTFAEPLTPPAPSALYRYGGGYWRNGAWVRTGVGNQSPYPQGTIGTVPPGQTQQPGTPAPQTEQPQRRNAPAIRDIQQRAIENDR